MNKLINQFFIRLIKADSRLLLLDYDGTLAPFVIQRDKALPYDGVVTRLKKLIRQPKTILIIISGRAIDDLKPLLSLDSYPQIYGCHGWEYLDSNGKYTLLPLDRAAQQGLTEANKIIQNNRLDEYLEVKPTSLALHFRGLKADKIVEIKDKIILDWRRLGDKYQLDYTNFDGGIELRAPGINKGKAVKQILEKYPGNGAVAYLGDDLTDEDAFKVIPENGLAVLVRPEKRKTSADVWLKPPDELLQFLDRWLGID